MTGRERKCSAAGNDFVYGAVRREDTAHQRIGKKEIDENRRCCEKDSSRRLALSKRG